MEGYALKIKKRKFSYTQLIVLSFLGVMMVGALILCLPISSAARTWRRMTLFIACASSSAAEISPNTIAPIRHRITAVGIRKSFFIGSSKIVCHCEEGLCPDVAIRSLCGA